MIVVDGSPEIAWAAGHAAHAGVGFPKMPFHSSVEFPDNLKLRAGYVFSLTPPDQLPNHTSHPQ